MSKPVDKKRRAAPLDRVLPEGQVVDRAWLAARGFPKTSVDFYLRSGALDAIARGAYRRPGPPLKWEHLVYSMQELGLRIHVGGTTALELHGMAQYLALGGMRTIHTFGEVALPGWVRRADVQVRFIHDSRMLFSRETPMSLTTRNFGHWDWPISVSSAELALFEELRSLRTNADFTAADSFFEAASTLRSGLAKELLSACRSVKVKRLFLWFASRHGHSWAAAISEERVDIGSGKRVIAKNGALDARFLITVPRDMTRGSDRSIF
jgi:hypothetical protein